MRVVHAVRVVRTARRNRLGIAATATATAALIALQVGCPPLAQATAAPEVVAAGQLQTLIDTVRAAPGTYTGLWIDSTTNTIYVATPVSNITPASIAALVAAPTTNAQTMKIQIVKATHTADQLDAIATRVTTDTGLQSAAKKSGAILSTWYPDPITDQVVIGFTKVTNAELTAVHTEYGDTARVITQPIAQSAIAKIPTTPKPHLPRPQTRSADSAPWYGGDDITFTYNGSGFSCTSGYEFGSSSMSTAGHCGGDPTTFYNNGVYTGETYSMQWGANRIDMQLMHGSTYLPYIWAGSGGNTAEPVSGSGGVADGGTYCTGGYVTGQNCSAVVEAVDVCIVEYDDVMNDDVTVCDLDEAHSSNGTDIVQSGDSGGPVYTSNSTGAPYAVGTISAANGTTGWWSDMYEEKAIFGQSPAT
jgi:hypothetical protein